ncbi:hypothetical protein JL722_12362 [Aureococcus anophagefferens]|nr:hypothetical protein JL722_12362 [Aureococcus anophagefferens]
MGFRPIVDPEEAMDMSVPVGFLSSTWQHPDLGYRRPASTAARFAATNYERALELSRSAPGLTIGFSMADTDPDEHRRARHRVSRERRLREEREARDVVDAAKRARFLVCAAKTAPVITTSLRDVLRQRKSLLKGADVPVFRDAAQSWADYAAARDESSGSTRLSSFSTPLTRSATTYGGRRSGGASSRVVVVPGSGAVVAEPGAPPREPDGDDGDQRRRPRRRRRRRRPADRQAAARAEHKKVKLRQQYVAARYKGAASVEAKAQMLRALSAHMAHQKKRKARERSREPEIVEKVIKNRDGMGYRKQSVVAGAADGAALPGIADVAPPTLRRASVVLPDPPASGDGGDRSRRRARRRSEVPREVAELTGARPPAEPDLSLSVDSPGPGSPRARRAAALAGPGAPLDAPRRLRRAVAAANLGPDAAGPAAVVAAARAHGAHGAAVLVDVGVSVTLPQAYAESPPPTPPTPMPQIKRRQAMLMASTSQGSQEPTVAEEAADDASLNFSQSLDDAASIATGESLAG